MTFKDWFKILNSENRMARPDLPIENRQKNWGYNEALEKVKRLSRKYLIGMFKK